MKFENKIRMEEKMQEINFMESLHKSTKRDYTERIVQFDKAACAEVACQFGKEYWDGLFDWLTKIQLEKFETISAGDLDMFTIVNTAKEAYDLIKDSKDRTFF